MRSPRLALSSGLGLRDLGPGLAWADQRLLLLHPKFSNRTVLLAWEHEHFPPTMSAHVAKYFPAKLLDSDCLLGDGSRFIDPRDKLMATEVPQAALRPGAGRLDRVDCFTRRGPNDLHPLPVGALCLKQLP
jgi:hypothetical protein